MGLAGGFFVKTGPNFLIEFRFARSWGGRAEHIAVDPEGRITPGTLTSATSAWRLQVGVAQYF